MPNSFDMMLAALPIITLIVLLLTRVKPLPAVLGAIAMLLVLGVRFPIGGLELQEMSTRLFGVTLNVIFILLGGLVLSVFAAESGAQRTMSEWFEAAARKRDRAVLLYGLGVTPFLEAAIGWGMSLIIVVPLLMRSGLSRTRAAAVGLLGLVVCPWGSLGPGLILTGELGGVSMIDLGVQTAIYNLPVIVSAALFISVTGIGRRMTLALGLELLGTVLVLWGTLLLVSATLGPALAGILGGLAVIAFLLLIARLQGASLRMTAEDARAFAPFGVLVVGMLAVILLTQAVDLGALGAVITSPGLWLVLSAASAPLFFRMRPEQVRSALRRGLLRWIPVTVTTVSYILFGMLLSVAGMSGALAAGAAASGAVFLTALPFISALAAYLTTAITSVATMLTLGVTDAAVALGVDPAAVLGVQTAAGGSAVGASPARVVLAVSIAAETGSEREEPVSHGRVALITLGMTLLSTTAIAVILVILPL